MKHLMEALIAAVILSAFYLFTILLFCL